MFKPILKILVAYSSMVMTVFGFWYAVGHPRLVKEPALGIDHKLQSVSYAPFEKDQSPLDFGLKGLKISPQRIDTDLSILSRRFDCIRTYSVTGLEDLPGIAQKHGLKMFLGAWVSSDPEKTRKEITKVIELARRYPSAIRAVVVGNEVLLRQEISARQLIDYIHQVRTALPDIPVTYADVWEFWLKHPDVAPAVDFVMIHILPYWEDDPVSIDQAMKHVADIRRKLAAKIPDREIVIGETGWPSEGRMREGALPSPVNQARFMRGFIAIAEQENWQYNLIEAFDQPWKRNNEGAVGGYWGLYDTYRHDKHVFSGRVSNFPNWPMFAGLSAAIVLLSLFIAARNPGMNGPQWSAFAAAAAAGAVLMVMQGHQFAVISRNAWEIFWAVMVGIQAVIIYFLVLSAIAFEWMPRHLSLKDAMECLRNRGRVEADDTGMPLAAAERAFPPFIGRYLLPAISINRLSVLALALIASMGLVFDSRYRSFNDCGFMLPALAYAWFSYRTGRPAEPGRLERLIARVLILSSVFIFFHETPSNWQADIWVAICFLLAFSLRHEGKGASLRPLKADGVRLAIAYGIIALIAYIFLDARFFKVLCEENPDGIFNTTRLFLGKLMYHQVFGIISLVLSGIAVQRNSLRLCLAAMIAGLWSMTFYNASMGAIAFVLAGLTLAHQRLAAS